MSGRDEAMKRAVLVIDVGTSNVRTNLIDLEDGGILTGASRKNLWLNTGIGRCEMDADMIWKNLQDSLCEALEACRGLCEIACVSFSVMGDSLVPVDGDLKPLRNMIMAFDTRARREAEEITYLVGDEKFRAITGGPCFSTLLCSKILWLKRHEPDVYQRARRYLSIQEYLLCRMGLGVHIDYTLACRKSLFDVVGKEWSDTIASCIGIDVSQAGGEVHDSACVLASLDRIGDVRLPREIPIVLGAHDAECGFLGLGVNPERDRIFGDVSGTYEMLGSFSRGRAPTAVCTPAELGCAFSRDTHSINGAAIAGRYISWYRNEIYRGGGNLFAEMEEQIRFDASSRVAFLMSNDKTSCALTGFDTSMPNHAVYQAIIEGITYRIKEVAEGIEKTVGAPCEALYCGGGGSGSSKWLQLKSDLLQKEVRRVLNSEVSSVGAAILGAVGIGFYSGYTEAISRMVRVSDAFVPNPAISAAYQERFNSYLKERKRYYQ